MAELSATSKVALTAGLTAFALLGCLALLLGGWSDASIVSLITNTDTLMVMAAAAATAAAAWNARSARGRVRVAWLSLAGGLGAFTLGAVIWRYYKFVGHKAPFPSAADAAYLILPITVGVALLLMATGLSRTSRTRLMLDALIVAGSFTIVAWIVVLDEIWRMAGRNQLKIAVAISYPVLGVAVLTVAVLVLARAQPGQRLTLALLTVAMLGITISDGVFIYLAATHRPTGAQVLDIGWLVGLLLFTAAAITGRRFSYREAVVARPPSWASIWLPFVPVAAASLAVYFESPQRLKSGPVPIVGIVLLVAFTARQLLVMCENRSLLATVAEQALRDPLTGAANRVVFHDHLNHAMQMRRRDGLSVGVLSMDLDDFKVVNDTLGHPVGDELLSLVAARILGSVRAGDTVARLGGDEFAVLIEGRVDHSQLIAHRVVEAFDRPFVIDGQDLLIRPSVGLAVAEADEPDLAAAELLRRADIAMYSAKRSRTGDVHTFNAEMLLIESVDSDLFDRPASAPVLGGAKAIRLLGELRQAIVQFELILVYQPKFDLRTGAIVGVEALVRWPHPERGLLGPDDFLPLVRRYGLMGPITDLIVNRALDDALQWRAASLDMPVAVNIFAPSLSDLRLPGKIAKALAERKLSASMLTVEITEDLFLDDMERTKTVLNQLQEHGIRVAIDDFGSGYSALSYLRDLPIDEVKLDRNFIAPILVDPRAATVVRAVVDLAHVLGLTIVAEGVEDAETAARLREYGCDAGQGFFYSPPLTSEELLALLTRSDSSATAPSAPTSTRSS